MHRLILLALLAAPALSAQWQLQTSNTTADLRGIDNVGNGVAWASGTNGAVLRTEDGGYVWQTCTIPPGAERLDFRGIQAFDANTAIVMSSGKGDLSRLYKTTDGCHTWQLIFTNPDPDGFWDALAFVGRMRGFILGDPVAGRFALFFTLDGGKKWGRVNTRDLAAANSNTGAFAASNSALTLEYDGLPIFGTSGPEGPWLYLPDWECTMLTTQEYPADCLNGFLRFKRIQLPMEGTSSSQGIFSLAVRPALQSEVASDLVAVGGDYKRPDALGGAAAVPTPWSTEPETAASKTPPHGYRSSVAYDSQQKLWITVGPNGTDVSSDDGRNWRAVHPRAALHETPDADRNWNALSLPFVVGPKGRIGKLDPAALTPTPAR